MVVDFFFFLLGTIIGSFLNVCIYRIPQGISLLQPCYSYCPACQHRLYPQDLFPIVSFYWLKGKCRYCQSKIAKQYPLVELLTGLFFLFLYWHFAWSKELLFSYIFLSFLLIVSFIDIEKQIIPNKLNLWGGITALLLNSLLSHNNFFSNLFSFVLGFFLAGGLLLLIAMLSKGGMGGGDVKLAAVLGLFLGWKLALLSLFLAFLLGGALGIILLLSGKKERKDMLPFGPFLALGAFLSFLFGNQVLAWYINSFLVI